jgi:hypothetical protein
MGKGLGGVWMGRCKIQGMSLGVGKKTADMSLGRTRGNFNETTDGGRGVDET